MPKPSAGHVLFEKLAGDWEGEETMFPSPWDPAGGKAHGRRTMRVGLSGFALISDYDQERDGAVTFQGHGVFTFNPKDELYTLSWFDCMGSPPETFKGRFDGHLLEVAHGGPGMHARISYELRGPDEISSAMEISPDGAKWNRLFDGSYRRV